MRRTRQNQRDGKARLLCTGRLCLVPRCKAVSGPACRSTLQGQIGCNGKRLTACPRVVCNTSGESYSTFLEEPRIAHHLEAFGQVGRQGPKLSSTLVRSPFLR